MPNGGLMPCCWVCHWGSRITQESSVACTRHHLTTYLPFKTFCADLALENDDSERRYFQDHEPSPTPDIMHEWLEFSYKDPKYPSLPQYDHEPIDLAPMNEFATWNKEQQVKASQARHEQKRQELTKLDS